MPVGQTSVGAQETSVAVAMLAIAQGGDSMLEAVKAVPSLVKGWKTSSNLIYEWLAAAAAALTIVSCLEVQRPSDVLAEAMPRSGAKAASEWLLSNLPPVLARPDANVQYIVLTAAGVLILVMLTVPLITARRENWPVEIQARGLIGARAASTFWVLLMVAVQLGSIDWVLVAARSAVGTIMGVFVVLVIVVAVLSLAVRRLDFCEFVSPAVRALGRAAYAMSVTALMTIFALSIAAAGPLFWLIAWCAATESESHRDIKRRIAMERVERGR